MKKHGKRTREQRACELFDVIMGESNTRWRRAFLNGSVSVAVRNRQRADIIDKAQKRKVK